jgi:hypothetical protein
LRKTTKIQVWLLYWPRIEPATPGILKRRERDNEWEEEQCMAMMMYSSGRMEAKTAKAALYFCSIKLVNAGTSSMKAEDMFY